MHQVQLPSVGQDSGVYHPDTAAAARRIISEEGSTHALVCYFTKRDGSPRRMLCTYTGATSRTPDTVVVFDCEKGAYRTVRLDRVHSIRVMPNARRTAVQKPEPAPDRAPAEREAARRRFEALRAELHDLF